MVAAFVAVFLFAFGVEAATCAKHEEAVKLLTKKYKERLIGRGIVGDRAVAQFFVSEDGTWTVLVTHTNGIACIVAAGDGYEPYEPKPIGPHTF